MEEKPPGTISRTFQVRTVLTVVLALVLGTGGCSGLHKGPRTLAAMGAVVVAGGSGMWAGGELADSPSTSRALVDAGFITTVVGLVAIVAAGGWMAASVACESDPDCPDEEQCREVPAPPGGIPYRQCVPR